MPQPDHDPIGPILVLDDATGATVRLAALFIARDPAEVGPIALNGRSVAAREIARFEDSVVLRARLEAPLDCGLRYAWHGLEYDVATDFRSDLRIAYASCNGVEHGDLDRDDAERNRMWARLRQQHARAPFSLILHGGDQIYADEVTRGHALSDAWPDALPRDPSRADLHDLRRHLRNGFFRRYRHLYTAPDFAWLAARVPALCQWDDHDICDGWGSLPRDRTYSPVGQALFEVARETCLLFQHATVDGDLPGRFGDAGGDHLGWTVRLPGLHIVAPDLRSQRTRRAVMCETGWQFLGDCLLDRSDASVLLMSSVPLLGPRLSIFETAMTLVPRMQKYEDDLRDQWQSRAHRASWIRALRLVRDACRTRRVVALSGEIHLAARAEMPVGEGRVFHQLVASGVTHRPPPALWARLLGAIATWGEAPLPGHRIAIRPLPGQARRYVAQRNTLSLERRGDAWSARWALEQSGETPPLAL